MNSLHASETISKTDSSSNAPALIIIKSLLFCKILNALSLTASWDAASTTKSTGFEESRWTFCTISGFCFNFEINSLDFVVSLSKTCVSLALIIPESIAIAIWLPIAPQPSIPILFNR